MSSRRKSTTPCMVVPSDVVEQEQEEVEEKTEKTKEEDAGEEEEGKVKEGTEEGLTAEELGQAVVVVPVPPDSGKTLGLILTWQTCNILSIHRCAVNNECRIIVTVYTTDEPGVSTVDNKEAVGPSLKSSTTNPPEDLSSDQPTHEQQCDTPEEGGADPAAVAAISLSKTPIMRMKTKSEPKRITVSLKSADEAAEAFGGGGDGELGGEQEPIEAPPGPMTPVEMLMHDSMKLGGGGLLITPQFEQQRKSSILNPTVLPAGLAQVETLYNVMCFTAVRIPILPVPVSN